MVASVATVNAQPSGRLFHWLQSVIGPVGVPGLNSHRSLNAHRSLNGAFQRGCLCCGHPALLLGQRGGRPAAATEAQSQHPAAFCVLSKTATQLSTTSARWLSGRCGAHGHRRTSDPSLKAGRKVPEERTLTAALNRRQSRAVWAAECCRNVVLACPTCPSHGCTECGRIYCAVKTLLCHFRARLSTPHHR